MPAKSTDLAFSFRVASNGDVSVLRQERVVTMLRAAAARDFLADVENLAFAGRQQLMARVTGNYKRGNERCARSHPRNSEPNDA